jgi:hypothetical protein
MRGCRWDSGCSASRTRITVSVVGGSNPSLRLCACGFNFRDAVLAGLSRPDKAVPRRFPFDDRGSALFEAVCTTPEYYIWRIQARLIESRAHEIATLVGPRAQLIEFPDCLDGGANRLLAELVDPVAYVRVDLSRAALQRSTGPSAGLDQREGGESDLFSAVGQPGSSLPSPQRPEGTASP